MRRCRICDAAFDGVPVKASELMFGGGGEFDYFQCPECGCLQIAVIPQDMRPYYPDGYYSLVPGRGGIIKKKMAAVRDSFILFGSNRILGGALDAIRPAERLFRVIGSLGLGRNARVLDAGCGDGYVLKRLHNAGFSECRGIDPNAGPNASSGGVFIEKKEIGAASGEYDLIIFSHSLEHMPEQENSLRKAASMLSKGGYCVVSVPTVSSAAWKEYGPSWVQLDAPRHFYLHSRKSFGLLAGRAGLRVVSLKDDSTAFQFWGSEQYRNGVALYAGNSWLVNPGKSGFTKAAISKFEKEAERLNAEGQGDQFIAVLTLKQ